MKKKTILKYLLAVLACTGFAAAARAALQDAVPGEDRQTTIRVYPRESAGKIKPVNGGNRRSKTKRCPDATSAKRSPECTSRSRGCTTLRWRIPA